MANLSVETSKTIAIMLLKHLIDPEQVATHFKIDAEACTAVTKETERAMQHLELHNNFQETLNLFTPRLHEILVTITQNTSPPKIETHLEKAAHIASKQNVSPYELSESVNITGLLSPSIMLASAVLELLCNPRHLKDKEHLVKTSTSLLVNTNQILQNSAIQGFSLALGSMTAVGLGIGIAAMREYRFSLNKKAHQEHLTKTITTAEDAYLEIHRNYAIMCLAYQAKMSQIKSKSVFDDVEYRQIIDLWLSTERYYQGQIQHHQKEVANISALNQRIQSAHRLDRAMDILSAFLTLSTFSGPPGLLAATIIRTFAGIGVTLSNLVIQDSARFNHGVRRNNSIIMISDLDSVDDAIEVLGHTISPYIGLSGPILRPSTIARFNIDKLIYTHASLAKKLVTQAKGRLSCSFSFSSSLPEIPKAKSSTSAIPYSLNSELRQINLKVLKELFTVTKTLIDEAHFLWFLGWKHQQMDSVFPYVVNFQDLIFALSESAQAIDDELSVILNQIDDTNVTIEESHLIDAIKQKLLLIREECEHHLQKQLTALQTTPHQVFFNEGMAIRLQEANPTELKKIKETYTINDDARAHWLNEIEFHLNAMNRLIDSCLLMDATRYIQNLNEVIIELRSHTDILAQIYAGDADVHFSIQEQDRWQRAENTLHRIAIQSQLLIKRRETHIACNPNGLDCPQDRYAELVKLQQQRLIGNRATPSILEESKHSPENVSRRFLTHLELCLIHPTPIHLDELDNAKIISPNRTFFGLKKHQDIKNDVITKLDSLLKDTLSSLTLQIMPLQGIDEQILASCQGNYQRLKHLIEGLKTEIQWVTQLKETCVFKRVKLANIDSVHEFYQQQLSMLRKVCLNKSTLLGEPINAPSFFSRVSNYTTHMQNSLHENVFHDAEIQLVKAENVLSRWRFIESETHIERSDIDSFCY